MTNDDFRELLAEALSLAGLAVTQASSGDEAFACASVQTFDVLVLDLRMPGKDGAEVIRALRAVGPQPPVILISAATDLPVIASDLGVERLKKPFSSSELVKQIRRVAAA
jgi:DNA-binding response OmpR family regulator